MHGGRAAVRADPCFGGGIESDQPKQRSPIRQVKSHPHVTVYPFGVDVRRPQVPSVNP